MSGPHDRFLRHVLEHPERAAALLRILLPPGFAARVRWSTLRSQPTALVDTTLRETLGDLSFSVRSPARPWCGWPWCCCASRASGS